ncbi:MAG: tRNA (adenosine(37)-N6)-threonylcarbamoyltransferase complex dimerization subunit type 1 TsaB [Chloroflexota bacterium]
MTAEPGGSMPWILAIDTGTSEIVVAAGSLDGSVVRGFSEPAGFRHGELLLALVDRLLAETRLGRDQLCGIVVGTGPGAFTGLRVGLATAKTMAHALGIPLVGVGTASALLRAATLDVEVGQTPESRLVLLLPAGPRDRVIVRDGQPPRILADAAEVERLDAARLVAVDLDGRAPEAAVTRGAAARMLLGRSLLEIGAERLRAGQDDDPERLVPDYVTLPRGIHGTSGAIEWSNDLH